MFETPARRPPPRLMIATMLWGVTWLVHVIPSGLVCIVVRASRCDMQHTNWVPVQVIACWLSGVRPTGAGCGVHVIPSGLVLHAGVPTWSVLRLVATPSESLHAVTKLTAATSAVVAVVKPSSLYLISC